MTKGNSDENIKTWIVSSRCSPLWPGDAPVVWYKETGESQKGPFNAVCEGDTWRLGRLKCQFEQTSSVKFYFSSVARFASVRRRSVCRLQWRTSNSPDESLGCLQPVQLLPATRLICFINFLEDAIEILNWH